MENLQHNEYTNVLELNKILSRLAEFCSNPMSKKMAENLLPSTDLQTVLKETALAQQAFDLSSKNSTPYFYNFNDITPIVKLAQTGGVLSIEQLIEIRTVLHQASSLTSWYNEVQIDSDKGLGVFFECVYANPSFEKQLETAILSPEELSDDASPNLYAIRKKIRQAGTKIRETLGNMIKGESTSKYLQDAIVTIRDGRYVVPVKAEHKRAISGMIHDTSASGSTFFIEPAEVVEANNDIRILKGQEQDEIRKILLDFSRQVQDNAPQLLSTLDASIKLNLYFAKANYGAKINGCIPVITDGGHIKLKKARHPLIDPKKVVPVDFELGGDYSALIVTGPNTGGKTVILKTCGLLCLMTMCGLFVPVGDGSEISIFDNILVDIGDKQSIEENLSTFSSHMTRVVKIIEQADSKSLVLLDELGSGTDPVEGAALAVSIIETLRKNGASIVATTHYQELKMYALDTNGVQNACCEFDVKTLEPTYKLLVGSVGKSNAFAISSRLGMPDYIISNAKELMNSEAVKLEDMLSELENQRQQLEEQSRLLEKQNQETAELKEEYKQSLERLEKDKKNQIESARREAMAIVQRVTRQSDELLDELNKIRKEKNKTGFDGRVAAAKSLQKSALNKMYDEANPITETQEEDYTPPRPFKKGDNVKLADTGKTGILVTLPDNSGNCFVQVGVMKTKINVKKLRLIEKQKVSKPQGKVTKKGVESRMTRKTSLELDIRGYACDEGVHEADLFINDALMSGVSMVTIIHGKGTGQLKNAIRSFLKSHKFVKSYRRGVYGEGEDGVTVVELK